MRSVRALATGAALAGLALTLPACTAADESPAAGPTSAAATSAATAVPSATEGSAPPDEEANAKILAGERKTLIHIAEDDKDWSATYEGPIAIGDGTDDGALFRIVPAAGDQYLIEALRAREEGGRWCLQADADDEPVSLGTVKCAENETTLFSITPTGQADDKGRPTHRITHQRYGTVQVKNDGSALYIQEVGDGGSRGSYSFVDRGAV
ncbi:MAG: hypothetical protein ABW046_19045 [Actinoplanes sp.]